MPSSTSNEHPPHRDTPEPGLILDELTGVYSIEYLAHQMRSQIAHAVRHRNPLSLILFSIDYLDEITRSLGAGARDRLLADVAALVKEHVRDEDVVARYGETAFAVLCVDTPLAAAGFLAKRIRQAVESSDLSYRGMEVPVTVSLGLADLDLEADADEHPLMSRRAEAALRRAQASGNCLVAG